MSKKKTTIIVISVFLVVAIAGGIKVWDTYFNKNHYTGQYIMRKTGFDKSEFRKFEIGGYKCDNYVRRSDVGGKYDDMYFYLFDSKEEAKEAFEYMRNHWFEEITAQDENSVEGKLAHVCDAIVFDYIELKNNLIITIDLYGVSAWGSVDQFGNIDEAREECDRSVIKLVNDF
ncbi:MAG: hypothetical protein PUC65_07185 [Clostridiales bacterium]|nr:hypothetical protein [Clostridiales bacterium]